MPRGLSSRLSNHVNQQEEQEDRQGQSIPIDAILREAQSEETNNDTGIEDQSVDLDSFFSRETEKDDSYEENKDEDEPIKIGNESLRGQREDDATDQHKVISHSPHVKHGDERQIENPTNDYSNEVGEHQVNLFFADLFINDVIPLMKDDKDNIKAKNYMIYIISKMAAFNEEASINNFLKANVDGHSETLKNRHAILTRGGALDIHRDYFIKNAHSLIRAVLDFKIDGSGKSNWNFVQKQEYYRELSDIQHNSNDVVKTNPAYVAAIDRFFNAIHDGSIDIGIASDYIRPSKEA